MIVPTSAKVGHCRQRDSAFFVRTLDGVLPLVHGHWSCVRMRVMLRCCRPLARARCHHDSGPGSHMIYKCHFCDCELRPLRFRWFQVPLLLIALRRYFCPHCGDSATRPITTFKGLFRNDRGPAIGTSPASDPKRSEAARPKAVGARSGAAGRIERGERRRGHSSARHSESRKNLTASARRRARELASFTRDNAPRSYGRRSIVGRVLRRLKRLARRTLRLGRDQSEGRPRSRK